MELTCLSNGSLHREQGCWVHHSSVHLYDCSKDESKIILPERLSLFHLICNQLVSTQNAQTCATDQQNSVLQETCFEDICHPLRHKSCTIHGSWMMEVRHKRAVLSRRRSVIQTSSVRWTRGVLWKLVWDTGFARSIVRLLKCQSDRNVAGPPGLAPLFEKSPRHFTFQLQEAVVGGNLGTHTFSSLLIAQWYKWQFGEFN